MTPFLLLVAVGGLAWASTRRRSTSSSSSTREDAVDTTPQATNHYGIAAVLLQLLGLPYWWGFAGLTSFAEAVRRFRAGERIGVDCSLFANLAWEAMGIRAFKRRTSKQLAYECDPVEWGKQRPGDLAYYPGHVMVVLSYPRSDGDSEVIGASGGGSATYGNDPAARVKVFKSARYRGDFVTFMRLKPGVS